MDNMEWWNHVDGMKDTEKGGIDSPLPLAHVQK